MKKTVLLIALHLSLISIARAQFLYAAGVAGGISYGKQGWNPEELYFQEQYILRLNGAALAEFFQNNRYKWRVEAMYNELGTKELDQNTSGKFRNLTNYISLNNYWVVRYPLNIFVPYFLIGPRVEYLLTRSAQVFPDVIGGFYTFHVTGAAGLGAQFLTSGNFKPFVELFYNHDIMPSFIGGSPRTIIFHRDYELRVGIKYVFKKKNECPPVDNSADQSPPKGKQ